MDETIDDFDDEAIPPIQRLLFAYYDGALSTSQAAVELRALLDADPSLSLNVEVGPALRRLFAELHRMAPDRFAPLPGPDPDRHAKDNRHMVESAAAGYWSFIEERALQEVPFHISYHFATAEHDTAEALRAFLAGREHVSLTIQSPEQADADDWEVSASTPARPWTRAALEDLFAWLIQAPVPPGKASFRGHGLSDAGALGSDAA